MGRLILQISVSLVNLEAKTMFSIFEVRQLIQLKLKMGLERIITNQ